MAIERSNGGLPVLKKEVLPPQKPNNGIGVMLVAATAMFFAVASSAFILRARMAREGCPAMTNGQATSTTLIEPAIEAPPMMAAPRTPLTPTNGIINVPYIDPTVEYDFDECDAKDSVPCEPPDGDEAAD